MRALIEISGEQKGMARAEVESVIEMLDLSGTATGIGERYLLFEDADRGISELGGRLGLSHRIMEVLWNGSGVDDLLKEDGRSLDIARTIGDGPFYIRVKLGDGSTAVQRSDIIEHLGEMVDAPDSAERPATVIRVFEEDGLWLCRVVSEIGRKDARDRRVGNRPFFAPISIEPKYVRAMLNLARVREGGSILDPFCGTGGVLIEGASMGMSTYGIDILDQMVEGARTNLAHFGLEGEVARGDAGSVREVFPTIGEGGLDAVVTDPPYGRATTVGGETTSDLIERAVSGFSPLLKPEGRVVMVLPDLALAHSVNGYKLVESHPLRVHRSLTRNFCIFERR